MAIAYGNYNLVGDNLQDVIEFVFEIYRRKPSNNLI